MVLCSMTREQHVDGEELCFGMEIASRLSCFGDEGDDTLEGFRYECIRYAPSFVTQCYRDRVLFLSELEKADRG